MKILLNALVLLTAAATALGRDAFVDRDWGVTFPETIASLTFEARQEYDDPKLGYSLRYRDEYFVKVDIYVYDKGYTNIGSGISSTSVRDEFAEVLNVLRIMEKMGKYKGVKEVAKLTKSYGQQKTQYLWARYEYQQNPGEGVSYLGKRTSDIYLTGARGKFLKVRITVTDDGLKKWENISDRFMEGVTRLLEAKEVSSAIAQLEDHFVTGEAVDAAKVIVNFAEQSEDVQISISPKTVPWLKEKWGLEPQEEQSLHSMLLAAYLAGNIKSQLASGKPADDPYAGWVFVCRGYKQFRSKVTFSSSSIDSLERRRIEGTLRQYARDVLKMGEPDSAVNESQPISSETNRASSATNLNR
jgi:hypothetical protein